MWAKMKVIIKLKKGELLNLTIIGKNFTNHNIHLENFTDDKISVIYIAPSKQEIVQSVIINLSLITKQSSSDLPPTRISTSNECVEISFCSEL